MTRPAAFTGSPGTDLRVTANGIVDASAAGDAPDETQIAACQAWLRANARPTKTIRPRPYSYALKHVVEAALGGPGRAYISNGAFIVAALREGYRARRCSWTSPNAHFNMAFSRHRRRRP